MTPIITEAMWDEARAMCELNAQCVTRGKKQWLHFAAFTDLHKHSQWDIPTMEQHVRDHGKALGGGYAKFVADNIRRFLIRKADPTHF